MIPKTLNFLRPILRKIRADESELVFEKTNAALTRFMENRIHQSTHTLTRQLSLRVIKDGRVGSCSTDRFDQDSIAFAIQQALNSATVQPAPDRPVRLPKGKTISDSWAYSADTASGMALDRAEIIGGMADQAKRRGAAIAGSVSTAEITSCVLNSRGVEAFQECTVAELNLLAEKGGATGYSYWIGTDLGLMPSLPLAEEALELACNTSSPAVVEPGPMTVVLDHHAAGTLVDFVAPYFGAKQVLDGTSFLASKLGKKICSSKITLWDDGNDPRGLLTRFDFEGMPKRKVILIDRGIAANLVTDSSTAIALEKPNTGHALNYPNPEGPMPANLFLAPGTSSVAKMIASTRSGIYVRKLHYVNVVEPMGVVLTGMTKDGTFLIKDGKLAGAVKNLRFSQSALKALSAVEDLSADTRLVEGSLGPLRVPAMKIRNFMFTGVSEQ